MVRPGHFYCHLGPHPDLDFVSVTPLPLGEGLGVREKEISLRAVRVIERFIGIPVRSLTVAARRAPLRIEDSGEEIERFFDAGFVRGRGLPIVRNAHVR